MRRPLAKLSRASVDAPLDTTSRVSMIEAAMPPMIGAGIVAAEARLDAPLVSTMIGVGIPIGLITATLWYGAFAGRFPI